MNKRSLLFAMLFMGLSQPALADLTREQIILSCQLDQMMDPHRFGYRFSRSVNKRIEYYIVRATLLAKATIEQKDSGRISVGTIEFTPGDKNRTKSLSHRTAGPRFVVEAEFYNPLDNFYLNVRLEREGMPVQGGIYHPDGKQIASLFCIRYAKRPFGL